MTGHHRYQHHWIVAVAALAVWIVVGWPALLRMATGEPMRDGSPMPVLWLVPYVLFAAAILGLVFFRLHRKHQWTLLCMQLAAVVAMALIQPFGVIPVFLVITAWQVAMMAEPPKALGWVAFQTLAVIGTLAYAHTNFSDYYFVIGLSVALQLCFVFTAHALRLEAEAARALTETNDELRSAQALMENTVRNAERLRIARELHDAWGHELTALGLQLEIASNVADPARVKDHVMQAKGLSRALLAKVRDVVATLREAERSDLKDALEALAQSVPTPAIHVDIVPGVRLSPDKTHALIRCAQEAVTNAIRHAQASNLWLNVTAENGGVRLVARDDGKARSIVTAPGSGLLGMRERVEGLGGKLLVQAGADAGFTVDAWLPFGTPPFPGGAA